jgi:hypothetical protein
MPSPFFVSNPRTPGDVQEPLAGGNWAYSSHEQGHVATSSNVQPYAMPADNAFDTSAVPLSLDLANFSLGGVAYNEPKGFEGSAEIKEQQNNNSMPTSSTSGSYWNQNYPF